jgi:hypothetical protein
MLGALEEYKGCPQNKLIFTSRVQSSASVKPYPRIDINSCISGYRRLENKIEGKRLLNHT